MVRAAIYCRVSTDEQAKNGLSLDSQQDALTKYATQMNYEIVDYYIDDGYTGTNLKRPGLIRLLEDVECGLIDIVLITKLDRWGRGVKNYYKVDDILTRNKVHWKTILENYDTTTSAGKLHINIMLSIAENESAVTSDRIKFVFKDKLARKEPVSISRIPYGYIYDKETKHFKIEPKQAEIIKDIFQTIIDTRALAGTRKIINERYSLNFDDLKIKNILKRHLYYGTYVGVRTDAYVENFCDPIISKETFDKVQEFIQDNVKQYQTDSGTARQYIFTGLLKCKECGRSLVIRTTSRIRKSDKVRCTTSSYACYGRKKGRYLCSHNTTLTESKIELYMISRLKQFLSELKDDYEKKYQLQLLDINENIDRRKAKKQDPEKIKKQIDNLLNLYLDGEITRDIYKEKYSALLSKLSEAEKEIPIPITKNYEKEIAELNKILSMPIAERYLVMSNIEKRRFWRTIIREIRIDNSKNFEIDFKY